MNDPPSTRSLVDWIEEICKRFGDNVAATGVGDTLTFAELWNRSTLLSNELMNRGAQLEDRIGLWSDQSSDLLVGMLGIMAAGAAFVPLDPHYPAQRLQMIVEDAELSFIVAPNDSLHDASKMGIPVVCTTADSSLNSTRRRLRQIDGSNATYVIFTSGSTGRPKGVVIENHSVIDLLSWLIAEYDIVQKDRIMCTSSPAFDAFIPSELLPLVTGGTLVTIPVDTTRDPFALSEAIEKHKPRILFTSPTMLRMLTEIRWPGDDQLDIWTGGERTASSTIRYISPRVRSLSNFYGPTEATVEVTVARLGPEDTDSPIGKPPEHIECILLDPSGELVPEGETGELFIAGSQLARGYLNSPELTAECFTLINTGSGAPKRAYRTGDLARMKPNGALVLVGRIDDQIKFRGYRIEPREIELRLMQHPQIQDAIVITHQMTAADEPRLLAFIIKIGDVSTEELRAFARETLPDFMIPAAYIEIDEFPLAPSGKIDKSILAALATPPVGDASPESEPSVGNGSIDEVEQSVISMFASVLDIGIQRIGANDDFFDLGGTSLRCMRLFMLIEEKYHISLPLSTLVTASSPRQLSDVVRKETTRRWLAPTVGDTSANEWEWALCVLWSEVLSVSDVARTDNFFELGGSKSDAERMIAQLKVINGTEASLHELQDAPTIAEFAALTQGRSTRSSVVPLNPSGARTPFFCIAGPGGLALGFLPLARLLGSDQPFYGLQAKGIERRGLPDFTVSQAAARYSKAIREVQPHGPYLIGGHSYAGALALKVAHLLAEQGETVALLAVFDSILPSKLTGLGAATSGPSQRGSSWRRPRFSLPARLSKMIRLPIVGLIPQEGIAQFEMFSLHGSIQVRHTRRIPPWPGPSVLYVSQGDQAAEIESGWERLLTGPWTCARVAGGHWGLLQRPHVEVLASHLRVQMDKALEICQDSNADKEHLTPSIGKKIEVLGN